MIGKIISHYKITEHLGGGGMGVVYKAEDTKLKRMVALKFLPPAFGSDPTVKDRFIHEAQTASALQHANICTIHEIDESDDGQMYLVMDYYAGQTLKEKLHAGKIDIREAINYTIQIAKGLGKAHDKCIVHRDVKPANIIVTDEGEVKILDFGLSKFAGQTKLTKSGSTLGTVAYMSPEQSRGEDVDRSSDIWSLGVMLYEMASGKLPFAGNYDQAVIYSIQNEEPRSLSSIQADIPVELVKIVNKCLRKNRTERYKDTDELLEELMPLQEVIQKKSQNIIEKPITESGKSKTMWPVILAALAIILVAGYFLIERIVNKDKSKIDISAESKWDNSIAVLPFADLSPEKDQEYFCDGMTEQIITNLSKIKRLKVIARTSVMVYKNSGKQIPEIGNELGVAHILEGSIRKYGNSIRVTAQLVNTADGSHLWADDFDRELEHVFDVQDDVSQAIASNLLSTLSVQEMTDIKTDRPKDIKNYDKYVHAGQLHQKFLATQDPEYLRDAILLLKEILNSEPDYISANVELADAYNSYFNMVANTKAEKSRYMQLQKKYFDIAYNLNPKSLDVLYLKIFISVVEQGLNYYSEIRLKKFIEFIKIDPNRSSAYSYVAIWLIGYGLVTQSLIYVNKALELNPLFTWSLSVRARAYRLIGEFEKAESDYKKALEIEPHDYGNISGYIYYLVSLRRIEEAEKLLIEWQNNKPDDPDLYQHQALVHAAKGDKENALYNFSKTIFDDKYDSSFTLAIVYLLLNDQDKAIELIIEGEKDYSGKGISRSRYFEYLNLPYYKVLHDDPRFREILVKHKKLYEENLAKYGEVDL